MLARTRTRRTLPLLSMAILIVAAAGCSNGGSPTAPSFGDSGLEEFEAEAKGGNGGNGGKGGPSDDFGVAVDTLLGSLAGTYETGFSSGRKGISKDFDAGAGFELSEPDLLSFISQNFSCSFEEITIHNEIVVDVTSHKGVEEAVIKWEFVAAPGSKLHWLIFHGSAVSDFPPAAGSSVDLDMSWAEIKAGNKKFGCFDQNLSLSMQARVHNFGPAS